MITAKTVLEFYEGHPERWIKGIHWGQRSDTEYVKAVIICNNRESIDCACLTGAIIYVYKSQPKRKRPNLKVQTALIKLMEIIYKRYPEYTSIVHWNDAKERTFEEVLAVVKEANI